MAGPLLETKLHVPRRRRGLVRASAAHRAAEPGAESALTLVSAPAGFGKTTLLAEWLATAPADGRSVAWLSLDHRDNDPAVVLAVRGRRAPDGRARASAPTRSRCLQSPQPRRSRRSSPPCSTTSTPSPTTSCWCSTTTTSSRRASVHDGMAFLLEHLPPQVHLVIASRADPALPLARLRARGELVEIRAADLRFTADEAAAYLNEAMGLALTAAGRRRAGGADRGLDRRAPARGAVDAGPRRRRRLHRRVRRRRPLHRRLPGRGGPAAPARRRPELPAADLDPEPADRPAVRRRHRPGRRRGHARGARPRRTCSWSRSTTAATGTATTTCSPTCCGPACSTSSRTTSRSSTGGRATGTSRTATGPRRSGTPWPARTSSGPPTWSSWRSPRCAGHARRPPCAAGSRRCPTRCSQVRPVLEHRRTSGR